MHCQSGFIYCESKDRLVAKATGSDGGDWIARASAAGHKAPSRQLAHSKKKKKRKHSRQLALRHARDGDIHNAMRRDRPNNLTPVSARMFAGSPGPGRRGEQAATCVASSVTASNDGAVLRPGITGSK